MFEQRTHLSIGDVTIDDGFWSPRRDVNRTETVEYQYEQLEEAGSLDNFRRVSAGERGDHNGMWFQDSDAYKWIEAASYVLTSRDDPDLESRVDEVIDLIAAAQDADGYLNTYFDLEVPDKRWTNLNTMHELYCGGHLIEAAVAHYRATGKETLLDVARAFADHVDRMFPEQIDGAPGHQEIELALMKLAAVTDEDRYRDLAAYFVDVRGNTDRYEWEDAHRDDIATLDEWEGDEGGANADGEDGGADADSEDGGDADGEDGEDDEDDSADEQWADAEVKPYDASYNQAHAPLRDQEAVEGHAVRAVYYFAGATDVAAETGDDDLLAHLDSLWENMTQRRMYVTGGIGSQHPGERFTRDYHLPNDTAYAETCAAIGSVFWNQRMFEATGDAKYTDLIEWTLYNAVLPGVDLNGTEFFYDNPLASDGDSHREGWFECACCPPNLARLLASLERYLYATDDEGVYVNQYVGGTAELSVAGSAVSISQDSDLPWDGTVTLDVETAEPTAFDLRLRVPGWAEEVSVAVDGKDVETAVDIADAPTYVTLDREWDEAEVSVEFGMSVEVLEAHPAVAADAGRVALTRGPLVYAIESVDHDRPLHHYAIDPTNDFEATHREDLFDGMTVLDGEATVPSLEGWDGKLYRPAVETETENASITVVPYYAWDNREPGAMRVWIRTS
ncbi:Putative cytoplasmic protein [Halorhabdus tiamatea SARL4B]|nr:beta-L-arabinofuranosidase domain-containing protein [Halorhabdus tiamatea]ERJ05602.1 Putative cytoplasmic protein [Halorhabdus tiamatea SARL4B]